MELEISPEKSGIQHASEGIEFLGYKVVIRSDDKVLKHVHKGIPTKRRTVKENIELQIPPYKLKEFVEKRRYGIWDTHKANHRPELLNNSDVEIILQYNAEMRGLANYYALANNAKGRMNKLIDLGQVSLLKTLAAKHKKSVRSVSQWLKQGSYRALRHNGKEYKIFTTKDMRKPSNFRLETCI